jgi:hypothetical protein
MLIRSGQLYVRCLEQPAATVEPELRTDDELARDQQRWLHLIHKLEHERRIEEMMASADWSQIEAGFNARKSL